MRLCVESDGFNGIGVAGAGMCLSRGCGAGFAEAG
jgi:hypothetical protein